MEEAWIQGWTSMASYIPKYTRIFPQQVVQDGRILRWDLILGYLKENCIKDFSFIPVHEATKEVVKEINSYVTKKIVDGRLQPTCYHASTNEKEVSWPVNRFDIENDKYIGKSFRWKEDHLVVNAPVKTIFKVSKEDKQEIPQLEEKKFPPLLHIYLMNPNPLSGWTSI